MILKSKDVCVVTPLDSGSAIGIVEEGRRFSYIDIVSECSIASNLAHSI